MELFLIDAIVPFFRGYEKRRINWFKIPFTHLKTTGPEAEAQWERIREDMRHFAREVSALGYNAVTLDDLAHLAPHPLHDPQIAADIAFFRKEFAALSDILTEEFNLGIYLTSDIMPLTPAIEASLSGKTDELEANYISLVEGVLADFPQLSGLILRIGESDGNDVTDPPEQTIRTGEGAATLFPEMIRLTKEADLPVEDIEHMRDFFSLLLRKKRGYRLIDHIFTLHLLGYLFRLFKPRNPKAMPKFLRKSAMGIDSLFK